jgi:hypothetical protein
VTSLEIPSAKDLWLRHETLVLEVFELALRQLRKHGDFPQNEQDLNKRLALEARRANFSLSQAGRGLETPPAYELPIQPASENDLKTGGDKRPDFSCCFRDHSASTPEDAWLDYHVECKRLGAPSSRTWNLSRNYVTMGICRFCDPRFKYGEGTVSGAMIGYAQSMSLGMICEEVNENLRSALPKDAQPIWFTETDFAEDGLAKVSQKLVRNQVEPPNFDLRHLWVDLRPEQRPSRLPPG